MKRTFESMVAFASLMTIVLVVGIVSTKQAHAYIDPATGSIIIQALIGALALGVGMVCMWWARIRQKTSALVSRATKQHSEEKLGK